MHAADQKVFYWIYNWPDSLAPFFYFVSECTKFTWMRIAIVALFIFLVWRPNFRRAAILAAIAFPLADGLTNILKHWLQSLRPNVDLHMHTRIELTSFGTASAHSANTLAVTLMFILVLGWKKRWPLLFIPLITGISRIYNGAHYPSQVLLGWLCGLLVAGAVYGIDHRFIQPTAAARAAARSGRYDPESQGSGPQP